jgi:hypothetical protein
LVFLRAEERAVCAVSHFWASPRIVILTTRAQNMTAIDSLQRKLGKAG